jgi:peptidoglycan/LPS O-acetylase OafA/YrhL
MGAPDIKALTGLRGYAALGVCVFHYTLGWPDNDYWAMPFARHGNHGVSVFFVLSGFILLHVYRTWFDESVNAARYGQFMWHRFARIYPLHMLLLVIVAGLILSGTAMLGGQFDTLLTFVLNVFLVQGWAHPYGIAFSWNAPSWTISIEFFAYLFFPFLAVIMRRGHNLVVCGIGTLAIFATLTVAYPLSFPRYFAMFVLGMFACEIFFRYCSTIKPSWPFDAAVVIAVPCVMWAGYQGWLYTTVPIAGGWLYTTVPIASAVLIFGLYREGPIGRWLVGNPVAVFLGNISYALYLSHATVAALITVAVTGGLGWIGTGVHLLGLDRPYIELPLAGTVGIALVVATALHYGFERPARVALRALRSAVKGDETAIPGLLALRA